MASEDNGFPIYHPDPAAPISSSISDKDIADLIASDQVRQSDPSTPNPTNSDPINSGPTPPEIAPTPIDLNGAEVTIIFDFTEAYMRVNWL